MAIPFEETKRLRRLNQDAMTKLVFSQLALGLTLCEVASTQPPKIADKLLSTARKAYTTAEQFMWRVTLEHPDFDQMTAQAERLRFEIENFGG